MEFVIDVYDNEKAKGLPGDANFAAPTSVKQGKRRWEPPASLRMMPNTWLDPFFFGQTFASRYGIDGSPVLNQFFEPVRMETRIPGAVEFFYKNRFFDEAYFTERWIEAICPGERGHWALWGDRIHSPEVPALFSILCVICRYGQGLEPSSDKSIGHRITQTEAVFLHPTGEFNRNVAAYGKWYPVAGTCLYYKVQFKLKVDLHYQLGKKKNSAIPIRKLRSRTRKR